MSLVKLDPDSYVTKNFEKREDFARHGDILLEALRVRNSYRCLFIQNANLK